MVPVEEPLMMQKVVVAVLALGLIVLALPAQAGTLDVSIEVDRPALQPAPAESSMPITGLDALGLAATAFVLIAIGTTISRKRDSQPGAMSPERGVWT